MTSTPKTDRLLVQNQAGLVFRRRIQRHRHGPHVTVANVQDQHEHDGTVPASPPHLAFLDAHLLSCPETLA
ncbi:hypothetical protein VSR01_00400 [Actinacidiphila sp. DG2A-62]|uniref:hypothetical protein n=1 Tax=Actinacidiphila sp. DG2A-62 TaxID=3108821 RepID=UPI002DBE49A3|nr:hypothetical protein [Actinacidiphila sp. DG2A-62]MEC3992089.1 hypothetical protein [Actinacidiphila sp. DG2A-62]